MIVKISFKLSFNDYYFRVYVRSVRKNLVAIGLEMKDPAISLKWFTMESSKFVTSIVIADIL